MKILVIGASSSRKSINRALARHAAHRLKSELLQSVEINELDLNDFEMPTYSVDRERETGIPAAAHRFVEQIGAADGLLISYAEHNGFYTAAFKNLFDWASRIEKRVFQGTPTLALATSVGPRGGANVLQAALKSAPHFGAEIVASMSLPRFQDNFDADRGELTNEEYASMLGSALSRFAARLSKSAALKPPGASMWDRRYSKPHAAYGKAPNSFLGAVAKRIPPGPVLVIGAGEGRNAVFLAEQGYAVTAMDQSKVGLANASELASSRGLTVQTVVADLSDFDMGEDKWSAIVSIWTHIPAELRARVHRASVRALKPEGVFILEAYTPEHLALPGKGGPPVPALLFDAATCRHELEGLSLQLCQDTRREVSEGSEHRGLSATVQVLGIRP